MKPGPPPTPTALLRLRGSHRATTDRGHEPKARPARRVNPAGWMSRSARAKLKETVRRLKPSGVLSRHDRDALLIYAQAWAMYEDACDWITKRGLMRLVKDEHGNVVSVEPWPHVRLAKDLTAILLRYQQELGMTPSSRTRVTPVASRGSGDDDGMTLPRLR